MALLPLSALLQLSHLLVGPRHCAREDAGLPAALLFDNGSLRPASTLALRQVAAAVSLRTAAAVLPCSLRFSTRLPLDQLGGQPAQLLTQAAASQPHAVLLPYFLGPSDQLAEARRMLLPRDLPLAPPLVDLQHHADDLRVVDILYDHVQATYAQHSASSQQCVVIVCDHGSPSPQVTAVRNWLAQQLAARLDRQRFVRVEPASMERRPGQAYEFAEPLLENIVDSKQLPTAGLAIIAMAFLSPGKHAGSGGDVATILEGVQSRYPQWQPVMTPLLGSHPKMAEILADRYREVADKHRKR